MKYVKLKDYDFIVKLDADLTLPCDYFEVVAKCFKKNPNVGMCGGRTFVEKNGNLVLERSAKYYLGGCFKAYRKQCFLEIGGLKPVLGWDGIDQMSAMYLGWEVKILKNLQVIHHRPTGYETGQLKASYKLGGLSYRMGYDLLLGLLRAISIGRSKKPYFLTGLINYVGYIFSMIKRDKKIVSPDLEIFIKNFQYKRIKKSIAHYFLSINSLLEL